MLLLNRLRQNRKPYIGDLRVWIPRYRQYTYPDVFLIQGQPVFQEQRTDEDTGAEVVAPLEMSAVLNPCLIVEVLSRSTKDYDCTDNRYYRSIPAFQEYILIDQYVGIEQYTKIEENSWLFQSHDDATNIKFASINIKMTVEDVYEVDFNEADG